MLFDQKIAIIGGSSGIGFAVAQAAADAGAEVTIGSSSEAKLKGALAAFTERVEGRLIDVTNEESVRKFFDKVGEVDHVAVTVGASYEPALVVNSDLLELKGTDLLVQRVGQPKDAAAAYIFAMENFYVTGQVLFVDGGSLIS
jgi:NAD(P)-dependent dehydrogenase (short-subunit alcohol dehydrogenase family)